MLIGFDSIWMEPKTLLIKSMNVKHDYFLKDVKILPVIKSKSISHNSVMMNKNN